MVWHVIVSVWLAIGTSPQCDTVRTIWQEPKGPSGGSTKNVSVAPVSTPITEALSVAAWQSEKA
jgi:hypothetical protein